MTPLRAALEATLVEDPDDVAAHMAYGDYLAEQGDPRGEFVQTQLALEDVARPPRERKRLERREAALLQEHRSEWLGALAPHFPLAERPDSVVTFRRGWIDTVRVRTLTLDVARALADAAELRLLRRLTLLSAVHAEMDTSEEGDDYEYESPFWSISRLKSARHFGNVTSLSLGDVEGDAGFRTFPHAFELECLAPLMPRLDQLHLNAFDAEDVLRGLPPHTALRVLRLERMRLGDDGLRWLARDVLSDSLRVLQVWNARFTDAGARALARFSAVKNLDLLDVSFNWMTEKGIAALRKVCRTVVAEYQMTPADDVDDEYAAEFEPTGG